MRIVIETDGYGNSAGTSIVINGRRQQLIEFNLTIREGKPVKVQLVREMNGKPDFATYFAGDIQKYDEYNPQENCNGNEGHKR